jgi:hypothetical protein
VGRVEGGRARTLVDMIVVVVSLVAVVLCLLGRIRTVVFFGCTLAVIGYAASSGTFDSVLGEFEEVRQTLRALRSLPSDLESALRS